MCDEKSYLDCVHCLAKCDRVWSVAFKLKYLCETLREVKYFQISMNGNKN